MNLDAERERLLALAEKATPGPWHVELGSFVYGTSKIADAGFGPTETHRTANAYFIAAAHDMAALIRAQGAERDFYRAAIAAERKEDR